LARAGAGATIELEDPESLRIQNLSIPNLRIQNLTVPAERLPG
jgi:hypothetical protein